MKSIFCLIGLGLSFGASAQEIENPIPCLNNLEQEKAFHDHPELQIQFNQEQVEFQSFYEHYLANEYDANARASYVIPVVFHVVHNDGPENIDDDQIFDALEKLNEDYSGTNTDLVDVVTDFTAVIGNPDIEFRLATLDPQGNCHPGITRTVSANTVHDGDDDIIADVTAQHGNWPQNSYLNIFICADPNGAAGYTNYPAGWYPETSMEGGIYLRHDYCGTIGTGSTGRRRTISHECAHWLNIQHCWGSSNTPGDAGNCGMDDGVTDTPLSIGWSGCDLDGESCGSGVNNVQNNMEYTSSCRRMFTDGQAARMHAALNSGVAGRDNLWLSDNLDDTGTNGPGALCVAQFSSSTQAICEGQTVTFSDNSYHTVTTRTWTFEGGTPASSSDENPVVTYNSAGTYTVTLDVTDGTTNETSSETNYIAVLSTTGTTLPYSEGFESLTAIPDNTNWVTTDENGTSWSLETSAGADNSSSSAKLANYGNTDGTADELISQTIDLSGVDVNDDIVFNFDYAYRKRNSSNDEWLKFYISGDCGETWVLRKNIHGDDLSSVVATSSYTPILDADWYSVDIPNITSGYYVSDFRFKFRFESDGGNNIYIDNINLYPSSFTTVEESRSEFTLYPNPATEEAILRIGDKSTVQNIDLLSTDGKLIKSIPVQSLSNNEVKIDLTDLSKGLYLIRIQGDESLETIKLL
ncbi:MAG: PKD repeat protein, partial [Arenicella sp.]